MAVILLLNGSLKVAGHHPLAGHLARLGFAGYVPLLGCMEVIFALLLLFPKTAKAGLLLLTACFGGAIAVEWPHGTLLAPVSVFCLLWLACFAAGSPFFKPANEAILIS